MHSEDTFEGFLSRNLDKDILRFITCGSVDDGKSTLLGRLLHDSRGIYEDQLASVRADTRRYGTTGTELDLALLLDGLQAEREQGITIDVAYRYFSTEKRKFIIADTPGHEQYTRNMATGASTADLAVILVDARKAIQRQTRRHSHIVAAMGIRYVVVAINKMDLVKWSEDKFKEIQDEYRELASELGFIDIQYVPISALHGDNIVHTSTNMPWYTEGTLLDHLEHVRITHPENNVGLRFPVQLVNRPHQDFRGYCGTVAAGSLVPGQPVKVLPAGTRSTIEGIFGGTGKLESASEGQAITVTLTDDVDVSRGCVIVGPEDVPAVTDVITARIVWMFERPLRSGDLYDFKVGVQVCQGTVQEVLSQIDMERNVRAQADELSMNDVGNVKLRLQTKVVVDEYSRCKWTGSFVMIDRVTNMTAGAGMIVADVDAPAKEYGAGVFWHRQSVTKLTRAKVKKQAPCIVWFTGLSSAGKSTIANAVEARLCALGFHTYLLDGDNLRYGLNKDLGFGHADRAENIRRAGEVARLMVDAGLIVLCAFVSPYRSDRDAIRASVEKDEFVEVYVSTPVATCEERDTKGLYKKARAGLLKGLTGVDSPYEEPLQPEVTLNTAVLSVEDCTLQTLEYILQERLEDKETSGP
ncbi:MAG TPA: sulfate adenylyltransferase subunit CysN [Spirochaetia bacterium]|nr:sulfate adenylyltransferase subunit CysN [Spirochaetia bacterium]